MQIYYFEVRSMDMLVNLLNLPDNSPNIEKLKQEGFIIRRIRSYELSILRRFVIEHFDEQWADEVSASIANIPSTCFVATKDGKIWGFAAYECTTRGFFGPTGVAESMRGYGLGKALLIACLHGLRELGYVYGVIGGAGPKDFYAKAVGAVPITTEGPSFYADVLKKQS